MTIEINEKELKEAIKNSYFKYGGYGFISVYVGTDEQYTKAEHMAAPGFDACKVRWWNKLLPNAE